MSDENTIDEAALTPVAGSPSSDADHACYCIDKLASECRLNPTAYHREGKERVRRLESDLAVARKALMVCDGATTPETKPKRGRKPRLVPRKAITVRLEPYDADGLRLICKRRKLSQAKWVAEKIRGENVAAGKHIGGSIENFECGQVAVRTGMAVCRHRQEIAKSKHNAEVKRGDTTA